MSKDKFSVEIPHNGAEKDAMKDYIEDDGREVTHEDVEKGIGNQTATDALKGKK